MPIYAYRCEACGFAKDVLQKISDPQLTVCLSCGASSFKKQLTAAGFQLKGTGWYATDFRNGASKPATPENTDASGNPDNPASEKSAVEKTGDDKVAGSKTISDKPASEAPVSSKAAPTTGTANTTPGASSAIPSSKA